jgi:transcriptional regulator GlxA family with amidase domain
MNVQLSFNTRSIPDETPHLNGKLKLDAPISVDFIVVPGFSMLALSAAIEPLRRANSVACRELFRFRLLSWDGLPVLSSAGFSVTVEDRTEISSAAEISFVCAGEAPEMNIPSQLPDYMRKLWRLGKKVGGISGGVFALAKSGILGGRRFTLHWEYKTEFMIRWPLLEPSEAIFCAEDRIITCAGEMASADMMLDLISSSCNPALGQRAMDLCLMNSKRSHQDDQTSGSAARFGVRNSNLLNAIKWIEKNFQTESGVERMYRETGISARQLQRLFKTHVGQSPLQYMIELRLSHARSLLARTEMSIVDISSACGFETAAQFSKTFKKKFGVSPSRYANFPVRRKRPLLLSN